MTSRFHFHRGRRFFGVRRALAARSPRQTANRTGRPVVVEANNLNQWGDVSGPEENSGYYDQAFEREVAGTVCKVLTAQAVKHVLAQLGETDLIVCQWLHDFSAKTSPLLGDDYLLELLRQRPVTVTNPTSGSQHTINPQSLGNRVLMMRSSLGESVSKIVPGELSKRNIELLRTHLESTSYISGSSEVSPQRSRSSHTRNRRSQNNRRGGGGLPGSGPSSGPGGGPQPHPDEM